MTEFPKWYYDELIHPGVDYNNPEVVKEYNTKHLRFRDFEKEAQAIIQALSLEPNQTVIDMGCGSGAFTLEAARYCKKIYAVDISPSMLEFTKHHAKTLGLKNIEFHHGGFLTYEHKEEAVDAIVSVAVLHHLPDFWKTIGISRMFEMLKPTGRLYLFDVVFSFSIQEYQSKINQWIFEIDQKAGSEMAREAEIHIKDEYSTFNWVMEGILNRAGFQIDKKNNVNGFGTEYICSKKEKEPNS